MITEKLLFVHYLTSTLDFVTYTLENKADFCSKCRPAFNEIKKVAHCVTIYLNSATAMKITEVRPLMYQVLVEEKLSFIL